MFDTLQFTHLGMLLEPFTIWNLSSTLSLKQELKCEVSGTAVPEKLHSNFCFKHVTVHKVQNDSKCYTPLSESCSNVLA
jgi:hypothetical protein